MAVAILIFLLFLEPVLSDNKLSWEDYRKVNMVTEMTMKETNYRRKIYLKNLAKIQEHNDKFRKGLVKYSMKMNEFGHLTEEEFLKKYTGAIDADSKDLMSLKNIMYNAPKNIVLPKAVDWRLKGVVTEVRSQYGCGSCYAFGSVASVESQYSIKYKKVVELSEQQVMDCGRNNGCKGGKLNPVFEYIRDVGLTTRASYPYEAQNNTCRIKNHKIVVKLHHFKTVNPSEIRNLQAAVALLGPVTIAVNATQWRFASGEEILIDNWCGVRKPANHVVCVVGYNRSEKGVPYWIIKNSWGSNWGLRGYVYVEHTKADKCGIGRVASIPRFA